MLNPIQDKPPASAYPVTDRITGVLCAGILLGCLLACLGPGESREAHAPSNESDKPIAAAAAYQRPVETGRIEELIEYRNPTPLSDELFRAVDAAADTYHVPLCLALGLIEVESGFDAAAVSPKGCYGLTQLNPKFFPQRPVSGRKRPDRSCPSWVAAGAVRHHDGADNL